MPNYLKQKENSVCKYMADQFFFYNGANTIRLDKEKVLEPLDILMKKIKLDPYVPSCTIINLKVTIYLNVNAKATKQT